MTFDEFRRTHFNLWNRYFKRVYDDIVGRKVELQEGTLLFPNMVVYVETNDHYLAELFGASTKFTQLVPKLHRESSVTKYLSQFSETLVSPKVTLSGRGSLKRFLISRRIDMAKVEERFGINPSDFYGSHLHFKGEEGTAIEFGKTIPGVSGLVLVVEDEVGIWGELEIVPLNLKKG